MVESVCAYVMDKSITGSVLLTGARKLGEVVNNITSHLAEVPAVVEKFMICIKEKMQVETDRTAVGADC